jgi:hypothetical protein
MDMYNLATVDGYHVRRCEGNEELVQHFHHQGLCLFSPVYITFVVTTDCLLTNPFFVRFEVLAVMLMDFKDIWDRTPCGLLSSVYLTGNVTSYSRRLQAYRLLLLEFCPLFAAPQNCIELPDGLCVLILFVALK